MFSKEMLDTFFFDDMAARRKSQRREWRLYLSDLQFGPTDKGCVIKRFRWLMVDIACNHVASKQCCVRVLLR